MPQYRELRPAGLPPEMPAHNTSPSASTEKATKRQIVVVACESCRKRKGRCDGQRPTCGPCQKRNLLCAYDAGPDATRQSALKQRYDLANQKLQDLEMLFKMLYTRTEDEAQTILQLIRTHKDVPSVLSQIKDGNLFPQESIFLQQSLQQSASPSPSIPAPPGLPLDPQLFHGQDSRIDGYRGKGKQPAVPDDSHMSDDDADSDAYGEDDDEEM